MGSNSLSIYHKGRTWSRRERCPTPGTVFDTRTVSSECFIIVTWCQRFGSIETPVIAVGTDRTKWFKDDLDLSRARERVAEVNAEHGSRIGPSEHAGNALIGWWP